MSKPLTCFKAYDVRGQIPNELDEDVVYRIGRAYAEFLQPQRVAVGRDIRESSETFCDVLVRALNDAGVDVYDIGLCGTEEVYFATFSQGFDGGIMITASHNPPDYNGLKFVREQSRPISADNGLKDIRAIAERGEFAEPQQRGAHHTLDVEADYVAHLWNYLDRDALRPLRVVVNAGNGGAGKVVDLLEPHLPFEFIKINHEPDGSFPNGVPNPMLPDNRAATADAVLDAGADLGVAWDGDYDRCFLFDEKGQFIEGYYIVGLLASAFLKRASGDSPVRIVHDPRLVWNTADVVHSHGGETVQSKSGHAFIKEKMRDVDAVYGGEMSAHHYFRDFAYCDSGMIPWLLVTAIISREGRSLSDLVAERIAKFPASGEINRKLENPPAILAKVKETFADQALSVDETDGISIEFEDWRFNLRASNTEPLVRLNVESRGDSELMLRRTAELLTLLEQFET
ncbi:MAG: phosphomannomutase [Gammaproteobacteria bacterium]|nr:phosphomannomutase [Gammaproteobacteria bacterium]NND60155.1 phosphomannomutase [Gammaproteobacteria bacterium]